jgi:hypothetical protein
VEESDHVLNIVLYQHSHGRTNENHQEPESRTYVSRLRFKPKTSHKSEALPHAAGSVSTNVLTSDITGSGRDRNHNLLNVNQAIVPAVYCSS